MMLRPLAIAIPVWIVAVALAACGAPNPQLRTDVDITAKGPDGLPGIFWLIKQRDQAVVGAWLDAGGDIEVPGFQRATPMLTAAIIDDWPMVLFLAERGARLDVYDRRGFTLANLVTTSRISPEGIFGPSHRAVRAILDEAGLMATVHSTQEVRAMMEEGSWPPEGWGG